MKRTALVRKLTLDNCLCQLI